MLPRWRAGRGRRASIFGTACIQSISGWLTSSHGVGRVWDTESGKILRVLKTSGALTSVKFSGNSEMVAAGGLRGALQVWSVSTGNAVSGRPHAVMCDQMCTVTGLSWTPDGRALIVSGTDGAVWGWDCLTGVLAGAFQSLAVCSHAGVDEHDQGFSSEWFELPGIWCAACHFAQPSSAQTAMAKPKPKDAHQFQTSPVVRRQHPESAMAHSPPARARSPPEPQAHANPNSDPPHHVPPETPKGARRL